MTTAPASPVVADWAWLGRVDFATAAQAQERHRDQVAAGIAADALWLCEHDPVITMGRSANRSHILIPDDERLALGVALEPASRGGDVTYHGPGQLVGYPIFRLRQGVRAHVMAMAMAIVDLLATFGIKAQWRADCPGVWVGDHKICAFGVHVRRGVAIHGFALNVAPNFAHFDLIVPCGLRSSGVTSMQKLGVAPPALDVIAARAAHCLSGSFGREIVRVHADRFVLKIANSVARPLR